MTPLSLLADDSFSIFIDWVIQNITCQRLLNDPTCSKWHLGLVGPLKLGCFKSIVNLFCPYINCQTSYLAKMQVRPLKADLYFKGYD